MLDFITSKVVAICQEADVLTCGIIGQPYDVITSKMAARRNFKSENRRDN